MKVQNLKTTSYLVHQSELKNILLRYSNLASIRVERAKSKKLRDDVLSIRLFFFLSETEHDMLKKVKEKVFTDFKENSMIRTVLGMCDDNLHIKYIPLMKEVLPEAYELFENYTTFTLEEDISNRK